MKLRKSSTSYLLCLLGSTVLAGCGATPGTEPAYETQSSELTKAKEVAPDRFCKAADRKLQLDLSGFTTESWQRVPGVKTNWGTRGGDSFEGPTWHNGALYWSNMGDGNVGVIWKMVLGQEAEKFVDVDAGGTNGLAVNFQGKLLAARQLDGSITEFQWNKPEKNPRTIVGKYNGRRFNAPNDLTIARDGTIYFTDPAWNAPFDVDPCLWNFDNIPCTIIQGGGFPGTTYEGERVYRVAPGGEAVAIDVGIELKDKPNGIMLGLDETYMIIGGIRGAYRFDLSPDGTLSNERRLFPATEAEALAFEAPTDGFARDCAGNIYLTVSNPNRIKIYNPQTELIGEILSPPGIDFNTNLTFGGNDGKTLFMTVPNWGGEVPAGIYQVRLNVPGYPQ